MAILDIVLYPDPVLSAVAKPVEDFGEDFQKLVDDMAETMYKAPGIGLAAPQVNKSLRMCVIDVTHPDEEERELHIFVNPKIVDRRGTVSYEEGCLSLPGLYRDVKSSEWVKVEAQDRFGDPFTIEADGLLAICMQHEFDHLDGVVFVDRLSSLRKRMALKEWRRLKARELERREEEAEEAEVI